MTSYTGARRSDEPPGGRGPRDALLLLADPKLSEAFELVSLAFYEVWPQVGYRQPPRRGQKSNCAIKLLPDRSFSVAERWAIARATRHPAFAQARQKRLISAWAVVRDLLSRLAAGEIVAFGTPTTADETVRFENWLTQIAFKGTGQAPSGQSLEEARRTLSAMAQLGETHEVKVRVAIVDGALYIDMRDGSLG